MAEQTAEQFAQRAYDLNLLDTRQLEAIWGEFGTREVPANEFLNFLVRREFLTNYQVERLRRGERTGYFYGEYRVLYLVGKGSFARVFRAVHRETGKIVAIKVLRRRFSDDPEQRGQRDQFMREGEMGAGLRHPNIVPIYSVHATDRSFFLVMDFIEGRNLRDFLKVRRKLDAAEATRLITEVMAGLAYAFDKGITHRDLKLSNILVSSTGRAQLVDFGLAAIDESLSDDAISDCPNPRTIDYAALERATGVRRDDARSDIYFAGCIYYNMLTGEAPLFESTDRLKRLSKSRFENIVPIERLIPDLAQPVMMVVRKAMDLAPRRRYQTPSEMLLDLKNVSQLLTTSTGELGEGAEGKTELLGTRTIMIVESNLAMQNLLRERLKKHGYRVLVIGDPARALERLGAQPCPADCVVFGASELGRASLDAYNKLGQYAATKHLPALLLLDRAQKSWKKNAAVGNHRLTVMLPVKFREFCNVLDKLFEENPSRGNVSQLG